MIKKLSLAFLAMLFFTGLTMAQDATVSGQITDEDTGETIPFANIFVAETLGGTTTDLDGFYNLKLPEGTYNITVSYIGYPDVKIENLVLTAGQEELMNIKLKVSGQDLKEVVVTAEQIKSSLIALNTIKSKSTNLLDGMASETIRQAGDGDAGQAIKRVTGVSVEGGKHVYVRGLGDRYTKTTLNGMDIPGLDPDRNSVELDIFPTNLVDNLIVFKTFSPDLAGDFTGGTVDITTKSFPETKTLSANASFAYNPSMHFNSSFLGYEGGALDALGFDDGTRALPFSKFDKIPDPVIQEGTELFDITNSLSKQMAAQALGNDLNKSFGFASGNKYVKEKVTLGYNFSLSYKNQSNFYEDARFNTFRLSPETEDNTLYKATASDGNLGERESFWSAMFGGALKVKEHKIIFNALRLQNGISKAATITQSNGFENPSIIRKDNLEYAQREVTNFLVKGVHSFAEDKHKTEWSLSPTIIQVDEPDIRFSAFEFRDGEWIKAPAVGAESTRTWRNLSEFSLAGKVDHTIKLKAWNDATTKVKFGVSGLRKMRDFEILNYTLRIVDQGAFDLNGNPDNEMLTENLWTADTKKGTYLRGNFQAANSYEGTQQVLAAYAMNELPITSAFKATYGVRVEKADNWYTGENNSATINYDNEKVLDDLDILPSLNLVYELRPKMNLRAAYNRTLARPSFKEKSIAQIQDRISGRVFLGNIDLEASDIDNIDLRWETFGKRGQSISLGAFYKKFINPIELTVFDATAPNNFQPVNVGDATVYGVEFEGRKNLDFIGEGLKGLSIGGNVTLVKSQVEMKQEEYDARVATARDGQTIDRNRNMVGQSPFIINAMLNYKGIGNGWEANMSYNIQGERLAIAGIGLVPDVYERPFHALNFKMSKAFGPLQVWKISVQANNILDQNRQRVYNAFNSNSETFEFLSPGRTFSLSFSYTLK